MIIKHAGKNLKVTRIPDMRTHVLKYNYDYVTEGMAKVLIKNIKHKVKLLNNMFCYNIIALIY